MVIKGTDTLLGPTFFSQIKFKTISKENYRHPGERVYPVPSVSRKQRQEQQKKPKKLQQIMEEHIQENLAQKNVESRHLQGNCRQ